MQILKPANQKIVMLGAVLFAVAGISSEAQARCFFTAGTTEERTNFNMGTITVQRDTPAGTVLVERSTPQGPFTRIVRCNTGTWPYVYGELRFNTLSAFGNNVYNTNIEGIGIRVSLNTAHFPFTATLRVPPQTGIWIADIKRVQLVKTSSSSVGAGAITTGTLARAYIGTPRVYYNTLTLTGGTIVRAACTVTTASIPVPLGETMRTDFTGVGSTTRQVPFNIPLNCNANTRVRVTLDGDPVNPTAAPGVLQLTSSSSVTVATGVGVQMLYNNRPVTYGSEINLGTATTGVYNIPLVGRYYQTLNKVTGGQANATATFTMTYN